MRRTPKLESLQKKHAFFNAIEADHVKPYGSLFRKHHQECIGRGGFAGKRS